VAGARNFILQSRRDDWLAQLRRNVVRAIPFAPSVDALETDDAYVLTCDLPGVRASDLEAKVSGNHLVVSGERAQAQVGQTDTYCFAERAYGPFERIFELPEEVDADHIQADLKDGVLTVRLPKIVETPRRRIPVQADAGPSGAKE
jgi:HSP20 family protein